MSEPVVGGTAPLALTVSGAVKRFGEVSALAGLGFELGAEEVLALVGPSGCGKSTLLRTIAGLVALDEGTIELNGTVVDDGRRHIPPEHRHIGLVFQEHSLFPHLTVAENIAFGVRDASRRDTATRVDEALELVALGGYRDRYPHELSGGERQRVSLARALAPRPAMLLLDEPFASLDPNLRVQLRAQVLAALRATRTPAVFVTHDQTEALAVGDRIAVMRSGVIEQLADAETVFHGPRTRFVAAFMGEAAFLPIEAGSTSLGPVEAAGGDGMRRPVAMVRPDDVRFVSRAGVDSGAGSAQITAAEFRGASWHYTVELGDGATVYTTGSHLEPLSVGTAGEVEMMPGHRLIVVDDQSGTDHAESDGSTEV